MKFSQPLWSCCDDLKGMEIGLILNKVSKEEYVAEP